MALINLIFEARTMATHPAVVTIGAGQPLQILHVPTVAPVSNEVRIRVEWTVSTPLDLHQADGGLLVNPPHVLGSSVAGTVIEVGPDATSLKAGDKIFGYTFRERKERAHQDYVTTPETMLGKLPSKFKLHEVVVTCNNFVSAWHTLTHEFGFELPWPKPTDYLPKEKDDWILIWGCGTSVGQYSLQMLKWYGYHKLLVTASQKHHAKLSKYGAIKCLDYHCQDIVDQISSYVEASKGDDRQQAKLTYILDCVGSQLNSIKPLSQIAEASSIIAIMLPVIVQDAADGVTPEYLMDVEEAASWPKGARAVGVRTHFYLQNSFLANNLQSVIMPAALDLGMIEPNEYREVQGKALLERAEKALSILRRKEVSGARLVWRVAEGF